MNMLRAYKAIRPAAGFLVDGAPTTHKLTAELFALVRNDGRIGDQTRTVLGGSEIIEGTFSCSLLFAEPFVAEWSAVIQRFPRDIDLRRGMLTGPWMNFTDLVASRDITILDETGAGVLAAAFLRRTKEAEDGPEAAALRWAVVLSDSARLCVQLQGLPATANSLNGKPALKR